MANPILSFIGGMAANSAASTVNPVSTLAQYEGNLVMPIVIPDEGSLIQAYFSGAMPDSVFVNNMGKHGKKIDNPLPALRYTKEERGKAVLDNNMLVTAINVNEQAIKGGRFSPTIDEANLLRNRELIDDDLHRTIVDRQTGRNPALGKVYRDLRFEIPGPSDLVRFAVRDCFTPEVVAQFEYAKETPTQIKPWMDKQGYGQSIGLPLPPNASDASDGALAGDATWFDLYWWSHWDLPSPTQGYEMLHRLYPSSDYGPSPFVTATNKFEESDLSLLLKASDYPAYWRERLIAISYHNLNRSDVLPMYDRGLVTKEEVYHALRADGYRDAEAKQLLRLADFRKDQYLGVDILKKSKEWICKTYGAGYITRESATHRLKQLGLSDVGIEGFLDQCDLDDSYKLNNQALSSLKRGFITGVLTESDIRNSLNTFLMVPNRIERLVSVWTFQRNGKYKQLSATKNIKAYESGLISRDELIARLQNLQYTSVAISTMLGLSDYALAQRQLKRIQDQLKAETKAAQAAVVARKKAEQEAKKIDKEKQTNIEKFNNKRIHKMIIAMTDKNIIAMWKAKVLNLWEIFYRLYYRDFLIIDARKWVKTYIEDVTDEEFDSAEIKAQKQYRSEPNPPLV